MFSRLLLLLLCSAIISAAPRNPEEGSHKEPRNDSWTRDWLCLSSNDAIWWLVAILSAAFLVPFFINCFMGWCGFTGDGVAGDSCASSWQSCIGNVVAGSCFACLQSFGARGTGFPICALIGGIAAIVTAVVYFYFVHACAADGPAQYRYVKIAFSFIATQWNHFMDLF